MFKNRLITAVIIVVLPLLSVSCSKSTQTAEELALEIRTDFLGAEKLTAGADITADYGDRVYEFTVKYTGGAENGEIYILSPEQVAGIKAEVTISDCTIIYDGVRMDTGALTRGGLSPVEAIPKLIAQWQSGFIETSGYEKLGETETAAITTELDGRVTQRTWFEVKTRLPVRSELYDDGVMVIACDFTNVVIE